VREKERDGQIDRKLQGRERETQRDREREREIEK